MAVDENSIPSPFDNPPGWNDADMAACLTMLQWLAENPSEAARLPSLGQSVARAYKRVRKQRRIDAAKAKRRVLTLQASGPSVRNCYICRASFQVTPDAQPRLCPDCDQKNRASRHRRTNLSGARRW